MATPEERTVAYNPEHDQRLKPAIDVYRVNHDPLYLAAQQLSNRYEDAAAAARLRRDAETAERLGAVVRAIRDAAAGAPWMGDPLKS